MINLLQINASLNNGNGQSSQLAKQFVAAFHQRHPDAKIIVRDVAAADPVPHLNAERFAAFITKPEERSAAEHNVVAYSDSLISELKEADVIVIGLPMYNFGVPSQLKAYFDHIARADFAAQIILADLRIEIADAEPRQAVLAGEVLDDADEPVDGAVAAGVTGRADDHRHAEPPRPQQHVLEIMPLPLHRARRDVRAERPRTDIARPRIGADQIRRAIEPDPKARRLDRRKPEMPVGTQDAQRRAGR